MCFFVLYLIHSQKSTHLVQISRFFVIEIRKLLWCRIFLSTHSDKTADSRTGGKRSSFDKNRAKLSEPVRMARIPCDVSRKGIGKCLIRPLSIDTRQRRRTIQSGLRSDHWRFRIELCPCFPIYAPSCAYSFFSISNNPAPPQNKRNPEHMDMICYPQKRQ